jgi:hypothetical protein
VENAVTEMQFVRALQTEGQAVDIREGDRQQATRRVASDEEVGQISTRLGLN